LKNFQQLILFIYRGRRGRDRMVVEYTNTCAINTYNHYICEYESRAWQCVLDATVCDEIWQFTPSIPVSSTNIIDRHDKTELLLKVVLSNIILTLYIYLDKCSVLYEILRDYYMTFSISALVLARDSHIKPDSEAGGLIWVVG
jgi:hypothetical protein